MPRAAIYARFSSDRQSDRSVDDQVRLCAERIAREGWEAGPVYSDYAISGAQRDRPGLNALLAGAGGFDILVAESLDRLSRDQEDIAAIYKRLRFAGARIVTLSDGDVSEIHIGLKGTMSALFLKDLGEKTRRGQIGNIHAGRSGGGRSYGYRSDLRIDARGQPEAGWLAIDEDQAEIVRRIFTEYRDGRSPRAIAARLNAEGVPAPRGALWRASTISGNRARRNGILHNPLYIGQLIFNRQRFEKDPETRRRVARPNPPDQWIAKDVPDLRIIHDSLWQAVQRAIAGAVHLPPASQRRPRRLLSGLVQCGLCGGRVNVIGAERWGCANHRDTGTCDNNRTISTALLEGRVLSAMKSHLLTPEFVEQCVAEFAIAKVEQTARSRHDRAKLERRRDQLTGRAGRLIDAIADGLGDYALAKQRLIDAQAELDAVERQLADIDIVNDIDWRPAVASAYRLYVEQLQESLASDGEEYAQAHNALRAMVGKVVMTPNEKARGANLELHGIIAAILNAGTNQAPSGAECMPVLVAGARLSRWHKYALIAAA